MNTHPKFSIITPCFNSEKYIIYCIESIKNQTYDNIEHIVVDGGSTDGTLDILKRYESTYNLRWISEKDNGMYDAITKGFSMATGDIFSWLNSDDMYMPWTCDVIALVMSNTHVNWCMGIPSQYTEKGLLHHIPRITPVFPRKLIKKGYMDGRVGTFIEQESMFWTKDLWNRNSNIVKNYQYAGDYYLWKCFAKTDNLYTIDSIVSGFRIHKGQKSSYKQEYYDEIGKLNTKRKILAKLRIIRAYCDFISLTTRKLRIKIRDLIPENEENQCS